jgi:hypothetical protein
MTPDDMEGRLLHYLSERAKMRQFDGDIHGMNVGDPREAVLTASDLRALLLDYQERGRALEDLLALPVAKQALVYLDKGIGTKTPEAAWLRARATLKGKSHD